MAKAGVVLSGAVGDRMAWGAVLESLRGLARSYVPEATEDEVEAFIDDTLKPMWDRMANAVGSIAFEEWTPYFNLVQKATSDWRVARGGTSIPERDPSVPWTQEQQRDSAWDAALEHLDTGVAIGLGDESRLAPGTKERILGEVANLFGNIGDQDSGPVSPNAMFGRAVDYITRRILGELEKAGGLENAGALNAHPGEEWMTSTVVRAMEYISGIAGDINLGEIVADVAGGDAVLGFASEELAVELAQRMSVAMDAGATVQDAYQQNVTWLIAREKQLGQTWASGGRIYQPWDYYGSTTIKEGSDLYEALHAGHWVEVDGKGLIVRVWDAQGREYNLLGELQGGLGERELRLLFGAAMDAGRAERP
jgi:hypothetical protein